MPDEVQHLVKGFSVCTSLYLHECINCSEVRRRIQMPERRKNKSVVQAESKVGAYEFFQALVNHKKNSKTYFFCRRSMY